MQTASSAHKEYILRWTMSSTMEELESFISVLNLRNQPDLATWLDQFDYDSSE